MKLPQISGKKLIKKLEKQKFVVVRQRGDHVRLEKNTGDNTIKITVPLHNPLKKGTLHRILVDAEVNEEDFFKK